MPPNCEMLVLTFLISVNWSRSLGTTEAYFCLYRKNRGLKLQSASEFPLPFYFNLEIGKRSEADEILKKIMIAKMIYKA
jgi:hypothetical protein